MSDVLVNGIPVDPAKAAEAVSRCVASIMVISTYHRSASTDPHDAHAVLIEVEAILKGQNNTLIEILAATTEGGVVEIVEATEQD